MRRCLLIFGMFREEVFSCGLVSLESSKKMVLSRVGGK